MFIMPPEPPPPVPPRRNPKVIREATLNHISLSDTPLTPPPISDLEKAKELKDPYFVDRSW